MEKLIKVSMSDFKLIFRDSSLSIFLFMPFLMFPFLNSFLPYLNRTYEVVGDYNHLVIMAVITQTAGMFGFIYCSVFLDEKDTDVCKMYGVLPIPRKTFLLSRLFIPFVVSIVVTQALLQTQSFYQLPFLSSLIIATLSALLAPILAIGVAILAGNKMEGMSWLKILNLFISLPLVAFILPKYELYFSVLPTFWMFKALNKLILAQTFYLEIIIGFIFCLLLLLYITHVFTKKHYE